MSDNDLSVQAEDHVAVSEKFGGAAPISFNGLALVRVSEDGKIQVLGVQFVNKDHSPVVLEPGEMREVRFVVGRPK